MIGYYVHHVGAGHLHRARAVAERSRVTVTGLSSLARPADWPGPWVRLERDDLGEVPVDVAAGGGLHWVPSGDPGLRHRMAAISAWIATERPELVVSDVSVEVALLARLHGVRVVSVVLPGDRGDRAHRTGYGVSAGSSRRGRARPSAWCRGLSTQDEARLRHVGGLSRLPVAGLRDREGRTPFGAAPLRSGRGHPSHEQVSTATADAPDWRWRVLGGSGTWTDDPRAALADADVVVVQAGQNAVADVAASRRPAVVVASERPFGEQAATARVLAQGGWPCGCWTTSGRRGGRPLLDEVAALDGSAWSAWCDGAAADRFADYLESFARVAGRSDVTGTVAVVTIAHGRLRHLERQHASLAASTSPPDVHVVVAMDDPTLERWRPGGAPAPRVSARPTDARGLPLAAARNSGFARAIDAGADVVIGLDVDCLVGPHTVAAYRDAVRDGARRPVVRTGHLPAGGRRATAASSDLVALDDPHPARPAPDPASARSAGTPTSSGPCRSPRTRAAWSAVGGFCEEYAGYGGEDTDLAQLWTASGRPLGWVGDARAYHQHHATEEPPVQHLDDILRNGAIFARRWGRWPMEGWLAEFERMGLVARRRTVGGSGATTRARDVAMDRRLVVASVPAGPRLRPAPRCRGRVRRTAPAGPRPCRPAPLGPAGLVATGHARPGVDRRGRLRRLPPPVRLRRLVARAAAGRRGRPPPARASPSSTPCTTCATRTTRTAACTTRSSTCSFLPRTRWSP